MKHVFKAVAFLLLMGALPFSQKEVCQAETVKQEKETVWEAYNKQQLYEILSQQLMQRSARFYIDYRGKLGSGLKKISKQLNAMDTETYWRGMYSLLQNMAEAVDDPNTTSDSDYLCGIIDGASIYYDRGMFCFEEVTYYETAEQTKKVDKKIDKVLKRLGLYEEEDEIVIIDSIHRYIINRITYDNRKEMKCSYSTYDGLFKQRTVCNGYALAAYKMLNTLGIPCKYISGPAEDAQGEQQLHAWNIVKIEKKWYHLDTTWDDNDDGHVYYDYFLRGSNFFYKEHMPDSWYRTKSYLEQYKLAKKDFFFIQ